jgi:uracil-DNA glycosylase
VPDGVPKPPSLVNIFKELHNDLGINIPESGNLEKWARQGVLLLNASLTVRQNEPGSHAKIGWLQFTDSVIRKISDEKEGIVFLLWGKFAQEKQALIDETKHFVLKAAHPSPYSANNGFFGCRHFSMTNELLMKQHKSPIDWKL